MIWTHLIWFIFRLYICWHKCETDKIIIRLLPFLTDADRKPHTTAFFILIICTFEVKKQTTYIYIILIGLIKSISLNCLLFPKKKIIHSWHLNKYLYIQGGWLVTKCESNANIWINYKKSVIIIIIMANDDHDHIGCRH